MQVKLLDGALVEAAPCRWAAPKEVPVHVRFIAASQQRTWPKPGRRRVPRGPQDRFNVTLGVQRPVRERRVDIAPLAELFRARFLQQLGRPVRAFTLAALSMLESCSWLGNVRQLDKRYRASRDPGHGRRRSTGPSSPYSTRRPRNDD